MDYRNLHSMVPAGNDGADLFYKKYKDGLYPYPSDDIDPKLKLEPAWNLSYSEGLWSQYCRNNMYLPFSYGTNQYDYTMLRLYGQGNQPNQKYKDWLLHENPDQNDTGRVAYESISWDNDSLIPRYREAVLELLKEMDVKYLAVGVDESSISERQREKNMIWEHSRNDFYNKVKKRLKVPTDQQLPFVPQDAYELELYSQMSLELASEFKYNLLTQVIMDENDWTEELKEQIYEDLFDLGIAIIREYVEEYSGRIKYEYVDPAYCFFPKSNSKRYKDIEKVAYVKFVTINEIRKRLKRSGNFETEALFIKKLAKNINIFSGGVQYNTVNPNNKIRSPFEPETRDSHGALPYDYLKLPILCSEYISWDSEKITTKTDTDGATRQYYESFDYNRKDTDTKKTVTESHPTLYQSEWVIGTDMMINWGPKPYQNRYEDGSLKVGFSIFRAGNKSMVHKMIPCEDRNELLCKKYQFAIKRAAPPGFEVDWDSLKGMVINGKKVQPFEILDIYMQTGILYTKRRIVDVGGSRMIRQGSAVTKLEGGFGTVLDEYVSGFKAELEKIQVITGITDTVAGADPIPGQLNGTTNVAYNGSIKQVKPLFRGYSYIKKNITDLTVNSIDVFARFNPQGFSRVYSNMSTNTVEKITIAAEDTGRIYKYRMEVEATDEFKQELKAMINLAVERQSISVPDSLMVFSQVDRGNIRFAQALLEYKANKTAQMQQQISAKNIQDNMKSNNDAAATQSALKQQEIKTDRGFDVLIETMKEALARYEMAHQNKSSGSNEGAKKSDGSNPEKKSVEKS